MFRVWSCVLFLGWTFNLASCSLGCTLVPGLELGSRLKFLGWIMDEIAPLSLWLHFVKPTELHYPATLLQFLILLQFFHIHSVWVKNGVKGGGEEFFLTRKLNNKHTVIIIVIKLCSMLGAGWHCPSDFPSIIVLGICGSIPADEGDLLVGLFQLNFSNWHQG